MRISLKHACREHQKPGRAKAALQGVVFDEGLLQRVQLIAGGQSLDGSDPAPPRLNREHQAGANGGVIDKYGAGSAHAVFAA